MDNKLIYIPNEDNKITHSVDEIFRHYYIDMKQPVFETELYNVGTSGINIQMSPPSLNDTTLK